MEYGVNMLTDNTRICESYLGIYDLKFIDGVLHKCERTRKDTYRILDGGRATPKVKEEYIDVWKPVENFTGGK